MGSLPESSNDLSSHEALIHALRQAHQEYSDLHPESRKSYENACKFLPGGNTRTVIFTTPFPLTIGSAYSCTLKTVDGLDYIDFLGEYSAGIYGHNSSIIREVSSIRFSLASVLEGDNICSPVI
jgi:glutamate-1-semialdehyde 2,1-aminomutase